MNYMAEHCWWCDYYTNFIEVERINKANTVGASKAVKVLFSRYGVYSSHLLNLKYLQQNGSLSTSNRHLIKSNGKAEDAMKRLFAKRRDSGQSECLSLFDWRNTPTDGIGTSPAQRCLGKRCRILLPM